MVNGEAHIFYEKAGALYPWTKAELSRERLGDMIQQIAGSANRAVNEANPILDTRLSDGSRVNIVLEPVSVEGSCISIRKFSKKPMTLERLMELESLSQEVAEFLKLLVQAGYNIFISGGTGCGKTTFINLLMRFYDPQGGTIQLDGVNTRDMTRADLRHSVGMVLQDTWLKAGTIRDNIAMGKPKATMEEVVAAAKQAHAHSFIKRLPQGYDTVIGESGGSLSQGQKQLLCIARVMLCLPPMLFLDEATSSIDTRTEIRIQKAFDTMMQGRTTFIVAHRLSTIREADVILVMKDGHIIEQGDHASLLRQGGFYAKLYESQFAH